MKVDGRFHCGHIQYEAEIEADRVIICDCTDCQTLSGSAFRVVVQTVSGKFSLLAGAPKIYTKVAERGAAREQGFCPQFGTLIFSRPIGGHTPALGLCAGTIIQRNDLSPKDQQWSRSTQSWLAGLGSIHACETQPAFRADGAFDE